MKVVIVGAGAVGSVLAKMLSRRKGTSVRCATNDLKAAGLFLGAAGGVGVVRADASKTASVARAARGADLIVNASLPNFNLAIMRAALEAKADYLDLDSLLKDWKHAEQLRMDARFRKAGLTGLINAGVSPGLTNLLAAEAADELGPLTSLKFRILEEQQAATLVPTWSPKVLEDELTAWPLIFKRGKFAFSRPFKEPELFRFPEPYGSRRVVSIYGDEVATVPLFLDVRNVDYKAGGGDVEMALLGGEHAKYSAVPTPVEMRRLVREGVIRHARLIVSVEADGGGRSRTMHAVFPEIREIMRRASGATYIGYPTALCAAAFALALPRAGKNGVYPAEVLPRSARRAVLSELRGKGVIIRTSKDRP